MCYLCRFNRLKMKLFVDSLIRTGVRKLAPGSIVFLGVLLLKENVCFSRLLPCRVVLDQTMGFL